MSRDLEYFNEHLEYRQQAGDFIRRAKNPEASVRPSRIKAWNTKFAGKIAGSVHTSRGYYKRVYVTVEAKSYLAHHLVLLFEGVVESLSDFKGFEVDHINGDATDNRRENLRIVSALTNRRNCKKSKLNTSGYNGVTRRKDTGKWSAQVGGNDAQNLGSFNTFEEAVEARRRYDEKHGFTALHGVR